MDLLPHVPAKKTSPEGAGAAAGFQQKMYVSSYDISSVTADWRYGKCSDLAGKSPEEHAFLLSYLNVDPMMDSLRNQERFQKLIKKILGGS